MAPVDQSEANSNIGAYIVLSSSFALISTFFFFIARTLFIAYGSIPVAYQTRAQDAQRRAALWVFGMLALVSLVVNVYTFQEIIVDSYWSWASKHRQPFPVDVWTTPVWYPRPNSKDLQLARWMQENNLKDCVQVMAGNWRDYWWQQQHATATAVWSIFLAIEGRRKNIPYTWAFLPIAHFVGLSIAQNLFYIALLFTPVPLHARKSAKVPSAIFAPMKKLSLKIFGNVHSRPNTWVPKPIVYIIPLVFSFFCTAMLPYGIGTPLQDFFLNAPQAICYLTVLLTKTAILPASFGTTHSTIHSAHASTTSVFRTAAILSFMLYVASTTLAVFSNTPSARRSLQSMLSPEHDTFSLLNLDRYRVAVARIIGALADHPIVQKIGWDVLLSALSLCVWAGVRPLDTRDILSALGFPVARISKATTYAAQNTKAASAQAAKSVKDKAASAVATASTAAAAATKSEGKASKASGKSVRQAVSRASSKVQSSPASSSSFEHVDIALDSEEQEDDEGADASAADTAFRPSSGPAGSHIEHEEGRGAEDAVEYAEGAALAWGLVVLGGLGTGMAGSLGAAAM